MKQKALLRVLGRALERALDEVDLGTLKDLVAASKDDKAADGSMDADAKFHIMNLNLTVHRLQAALKDIRNNGSCGIFRTPTGTRCSICDGFQYDTPNGVICENEHKDAPPRGEDLPF